MFSTTIEDTRTQDFFYFLSCVDVPQHIGTLEQDSELSVNKNECTPMYNEDMKYVERVILKIV